MKALRAVAGVAILALACCAAAVPQMSREQISFLRKSQQNSLLAKTVNQPRSTACYDKGKPEAPGWPISTMTPSPSTPCMPRTPRRGL